MPRLLLAASALLLSNGCRAAATRAPAYAGDPVSAPRRASGETLPLLGRGLPEQRGSARAYAALARITHTGGELHKLP